MNNNCYVTMYQALWRHRQAICQHFETTRGLELDYECIKNQTNYLFINKLYWFDFRINNPPVKLQNCWPHWLRYISNYLKRQIWMDWVQKSIFSDFFEIIIYIPVYFKIKIVLKIITDTVSYDPRTWIKLHLCTYFH